MLNNLEEMITLQG